MKINKKERNVWIKGNMSIMKIEIEISVISWKNMISWWQGAKRIARYVLLEQFSSCYSRSYPQQD
ncbi:MAG: hypothetical protein ACTSYC_04295 [Promethearchaeota archaeon]